MYACVHVCLEDRGIRSSELMLQVVVNHQMKILGIKLRSLARAVCALNCWIISAASLVCSWSTKRKVKSIQVINWIFFFITVYLYSTEMSESILLPEHPNFVRMINTCCLWTLLCPDKQWNFEVVYYMLIHIYQWI